MGRIGGIGQEPRFFAAACAVQHEQDLLSIGRELHTGDVGQFTEYFWNGPLGTGPCHTV